MNSGNVRLWAVGAINIFLFLCAGCAKTEIQAEEVPIFTKNTPTVAAVAAADNPVAADEAAEGKAPAKTTDTNAPPVDPAVKVVQTPTTPKNLQLSPGLAEVAKLAQAGLSEEVLLSYILNSTNVYSLGSDEIVYLNDLGVSSTVIAELIKRDNSAEARELKRVAGAASPLPPGIALNTPATNIYYQTRPAPVTFTEPAPGANTEQEPQPIAAAPAPQYVAAESVPADSPAAAFYEPLSPYGNWVQVENYGLCWQPTVAVVNQSWRPYGDHGRWYWSDAGWYWYSDYSWGWAPFHYGRWSSSPRVGWFWVPDRVWGPSWVTWRYSDNYCGWAPLPPHCNYVSGFGLQYHSGAVSVGLSFGFGAFDYNFVSWNHFYGHSPHHHFAHRSHKNGIFKETTVVNNYVVGNNNTIINEGVGLQRAARRTRTEITRVPIRSAPLPENRAARPERLVNEGSTLAVVRPELPGRPVAKPASDTRSPRSERFLSPPRSGQGAGNSTPTEASGGRFMSERNTTEAANNRTQVAPRENQTVKALFGAPGRPVRKSVAEQTASIDTAPAKNSGTSFGRTQVNSSDNQTATAVQPLPATTTSGQQADRGRPGVAERNGTSFGQRPVARSPFESATSPQAATPSRPLTQPNRTFPAPVSSSAEPNGVVRDQSADPVIPSRPGNTSFGSYRQQPAPVLRSPPPITSSPAPITRNPSAITRNPPPITSSPPPITRNPSPLASPVTRPQASVQQPRFAAPAQRPSVSAPAPRPSVSAPASRPAQVQSAPAPAQSAPSSSGRASNPTSFGSANRPDRNR